MKTGLYALYTLLSLSLLSTCQKAANLAEPQIIPFADLVSESKQFAGQRLCTEGTAVSGFEASAIAVDTIERDGAVYLTEPAIWLENIVPGSKSDCFTTGLPPAEFCRMRVCGRFETGGGFGHLGGYHFQLVGSSTETIVPMETVIAETAVPARVMATPPIVLPEPTGKPGIWNGRATYASPDDENAPMFSLNFDPAIWELLPPTDNQPESHLSQRQLAGCTLTPSVGRGLPDDWTVENGYETIGSVGYELFRASQDEELRFINYCTAVSDSYTCFTVQLSQPTEPCQQAAEELLETLASSPSSRQSP